MSETRGMVFRRHRHDPLADNIVWPLPTIEIIEADRKVLHLDVRDLDPVAVVVRLWADAGGALCRDPN